MIFLSKLLSLNLLLVFVPASLITHFAYPKEQVLLFIFSSLAIVPLAGWLGRATEHLAAKTNEALGGLLNATFGNAAELIISFVALSKGYTDVVKASLTGSIIGNVLLVLGAAFFAGGLKTKEQRFNATGASAQSTMLFLAAIGLVVPAVVHHLSNGAQLVMERNLSFDISLVLIATYAIGLVFSLKTHKELFCGEVEDDLAESEGHWGLGKSITILVSATALIAWMSELLVGSVEEAAHSFGMNNVFIGVIVVAIVGNAAEHSTAILFALKDRMELALGIAYGSSVQIALFVAPLLVLLSHTVLGVSMDLVFTPLEVIAIGLSVLIGGQIASDGKSNWLEGVQLISVYCILGLAFYFMPV